MISVDLNCDMGESFGAWTIGNDSALMDYCTSINIACGFHAGDATVIRKTIEIALEKRIAIGAHPSFPDLQGFGRRLMQLSAQEVFDVVLYQVAAVYQMTAALGGELHHVKPHGALYNEAAKKPELAEAIARAVKAIDENLVFYGLSGSFLISEGEKINLKTASEVFADRTYNADGSLTPRSQPNALICDTNKAVEQVLQMIQTQTVTATNSETIRLKADTVCIHGDGANALEFAAAVRAKLNEKGVRICPV
ncbi:MAG TPA: 5-oxoprolinase subunit PxpA [Pyrinomonadaceae bacterium]|jgi:UPF0271 protein